MSKKDLVQELREFAKDEEATGCETWIHFRGESELGCTDIYCSECRRLALNAIADRIEAEYLPRPCFEDGEPVQFGDEFECGRVGTVDTIAFSRDGTVQIKGLDKKSFQVNFDYEEGQAVKRPKYQDTVEKVAVEMLEYMNVLERLGRKPREDVVSNYTTRLEALRVKFDD
jgi:hypothetical protein